MRKFFNKKISIFLKMILAALGFSVCWACAKYGEPEATYRIRGEVVSSENEQPIANIEAVLFHQSNGEQNEEQRILTDEKGGFIFERWVTASVDTFHVRFTDIDSTDNGEFLSKDIHIIFDNATFTGGYGQWDEGIAEKNVGKIFLNPKK